MEYGEILAKMLQKETISEMDPEQDKTKFREFHVLLRELFPNVFKACEFEEFDGSILLRWPCEEGSDPIEAAKKNAPVLFMNHHDVVEASGNWKYPPFSGTIAEGKVWGRGAIDTKGGLFGMLQGAEELIMEGFKPRRDIYFQSACNEETTGLGSDSISKVLQERGIRFKFLLDEGGMILYDPIGGADGTFAMIGVGEKGCADLKFIAHSNGGHASTPDKDTPLVRLGKFMAECDNGKIFDAYVSDAVTEMFSRMAPTMNGITKALLGNAKNLRNTLKRILPNISPTANALVKTTIAFTMAQGSGGTNVIPEEAWVIGNMRYSHHQGREESINEIIEVAKKYDLEVEVLDPGFESELSDYNADEFKLLEEGVRENFDGVYTSPYIMTGASDARFFGRVCDKCYRFVPFVISEEQLEGIHGLNESVDLDTLGPAVDFYKYVMKNA